MFPMVLPSAVGRARVWVRGIEAVRILHAVHDRLLGAHGYRGRSFDNFHAHFGRGHLDRISVCLVLLAVLAVAFSVVVLLGPISRRKCKVEFVMSSMSYELQYSM